MYKLYGFMVKSFLLFFITTILLLWLQNGKCRNI